MRWRGGSVLRFCLAHAVGAMHLPAHASTHNNTKSVTRPEGTLAELLARLGTPCELTPGAVLWRQGDPGEEVVLLATGTLEAVHLAADGREVILQTLTAGSIIGELACLDGQSRSAGVRAAAHCRLARYPAAQFRQLVHRRPDILEDLLRQQLERVRRLTGVVSALGGGAAATVFVTMGDGLATSPADGWEAHALTRSADANLYRAKQRGRNRVVDGGSTS